MMVVGMYWIVVMYLSLVVVIMRYEIWGYINFYNEFFFNEKKLFIFLLNRLFKYVFVELLLKIGRI